MQAVPSSRFLLQKKRYTLFRKTITTLAVAAATAAVAGVVTAAPAQAATGCSPTNGYGERLCVTSVNYDPRDGLTSIQFTLAGPWTDYRVSANDTSNLYYPGANSIGVDGRLYTQVCVTEGTTHWRACV
ncbi:hypothetical protein [Embleya sp. AB8]|uniref:hypothetical protein n=1 Tax=Embleya sp. AB8 TaxID=3156304 RepID=UPI003C764D76